MEQLNFITDDGEEVTFGIIEETRVNGVNYLLVTESEDDEECYILKDVSNMEDTEAAYEFVEDDDELELVGKVFEALLEDEE